MVKNFALVVAVVVSLVAASSAQAFGHRGCRSCNGGCSGGACSVPMGTKTAATDAPPLPVASAPTTQPALVAAPTNSYASVRRGLFGRR
jgi:hypothetical protein